jgi:hypothetical protein
VPGGTFDRKTCTWAIFNSIAFSYFSKEALSTPLIFPYMSIFMFMGLGSQKNIIGFIYTCLVTKNALALVLLFFYSFAIFYLKDQRLKVQLCCKKNRCI